MVSKKARLLILVSSGLFLLLDQFLKWQALYHWTKPRLFSPYFGWQLYLNNGTAFNLRLANNFIILLTLPMIFLIGYLVIREFSRNKPAPFLAWTLTFAGAISNLIDRVAYQRVVDYFLIGTAIINIGDIMIVVGLGIYLLSLRPA